MVNHIAQKVGATVSDEKTITLHSVYGTDYGYAKGFSLSYCTSSIEGGPSEDYSKELLNWIQGLGFSIANSYGDNGLDPYASGDGDTFWTYEFIYEPTEVSKEQFITWNNDEFDE